MKKTIHKYELLPPRGGRTMKLPLPKGAQILSIQASQDDGIPCLWALIDESQPVVIREIAVVGTDWDLAEGDYSDKFICTFQMNGMGRILVFHAFDKGERESFEQGAAA